MRRLLLTLLAIASFELAVAEPEVGIAELPDWSTSRSIQEFKQDRSAEFQYGIAYLLSDMQVRKTDKGYDYVRRFAYRVVDRSGLENAARITSVFDPSDEVMAFNFVRVVRDGDVDERLDDIEITLLRQEERLQSSLVDGRMTALVELEDVRVGDIVDYSLSGSVDSKLWPNDYFDVVNVEWSVPLAQMIYELHVPEGFDIEFHRIATDVEPRVSTADGWTSYKVQVVDDDPVRVEENLPRDWNSTGFIALTTMASWSDVVAWANPLYQFDAPLPRDFTRQLDAIARAYPRPEDRALHALRLVQEDIRYLGIEVAIGSHVPRPPQVTLERGYGDCKDKSVLLVAALAYLDVDAAPALASLSIGDMLPKVPPSISMFDHVIVEIDIDGKKSWVDPTLSHQGGLAENLVELDYGYVLPLRDGQSELVELDVPVPDLPSFEVLESFELPQTGDTGLKLAIEYTYREASANAMRYQLISLGEQDWARDFLDYYAGIYRGMVESAPFEINDDLDANEIVIRAEYAVGMDTFLSSGYAEELPVYATAVQDELPRRVEADRTAPLGLAYGTNLRHTIRVNRHGYRFNPPENETTRLHGITFTQEFADDEGTFELDFNLIIAREEATVEAIADITDLADEIVESTDLTIRLRSAVPVSAEAPPETGIKFDAATEAAVKSIDEYLENEEYIDALIGLNTILARHTEATEVRGFLLLKKASVLVDLDRNPAAIPPFREAFELYSPPEPRSYFRFASALRAGDKNGEIVPLLERLLEEFPAAIHTMNLGWMRRLYFALREDELVAEANTMALTLARAAHQGDVDDPDEFSWVFYRAVENLAAEGNKKEAALYLPYLRNPIIWARLLTSRRTAAIWDAVEEKAGKDIAEGIADYVTYTKLQANLAPEDYEVLTKHVAALRIAGKHDEAIRFANLFIDNWARIEAVRDDAFWFVNEAASALSDAGRKDEAIALLTRLVDLGVEAHGDLISMAINRAAMMMNWGDFETALSTAEDLEKIADDYASDYGRLWIYSTKACSLHQLGETARAETVYTDSIVGLADKNRAAQMMTMLCLDKTEAATAALIERLEDPDESADLIVSFSEFESPAAPPPFLAELQRRARVVRQQNDVEKAFRKIGRSISISGVETYWGEF